MRFVVAGSGCCGTSFLADAFTAAGLTCGHEAVFDHDRTTSGTDERWLVPHLSDARDPYPGPLAGDSSLAAVGYDLSAYVVVALVRDPVAVICSFLGEAFFADRCDGRCTHGDGEHLESPYYQFMRTVVPALDDCESEIDRAVLWVVESSRLAAAQAEGLVVRVEHVHDIGGLAALVARRCGIDLDPEPVDLDHVDRHHHRGNGDRLAVIEALSASPLLPMFARHCRRFRYERTL